MRTLPPLSLYVHIPWCVRKCPYCDFNSHEKPQNLPVAAYLTSLKEDLNQDTDLAQGRKISSIFFGGGTPSLFPSEAIGEIIDHADRRIGIDSDAEITLEANPGTAEYDNFSLLKSAGINRLSFGVQSFNDEHLTKLGRIHNGQEAATAVALARDCGIDDINIDLMHGLPNQTTEQALEDIERALSLTPQHLSWYQLTIEPNTHFYSQPPTLPVEDTLFNIQDLGHQRLSEAGLKQYEVSAYANAGKRSRHNLNYWRFGDYMGIGAGAHGKISYLGNKKICRYRKTRLPNDYMNSNKPYTAGTDVLAAENLPLEFLMNALRLNEGVDTSLMLARTGVDITHVQKIIEQQATKGLLQLTDSRIRTTELGRRFLNSLLEAFM